MFHFKFNQVFVGLIALAFLSAFILPPDLSNPLRGLQALFAPVSRPTRAIAGSLHDRFAANHRDTREADQVKDENEQLRVLVMSLSGQLQELKRVANDFDRLGDVRPLCTRFKVVGDDPGTRDSIMLAASSRDQVKESQPVLSGQGLVGIVERVGQAGAQVRLITDKDFKVSGQFVRFNSNKTETREQTLATTIPLVRGAGKGQIEILNIQLKETALTDDPLKEKVAVGDYVKLEDPLWPPNVSGRLLGRVESITQQSGAPQHALIRVRPLLELKRLREVMVMNKLDVPEAQTAGEKSAGTN
ncbi:MAG: hypothetical protein QOF78_3763 [Phycisphaerales bacterium]|jgi:cell shape-determining protein MreC|nr:hypothetical protein [Phycisphaerales bacterium]